MKVTNTQFQKFSQLVSRECGIHLHDGKKQLLQARLAKRLHYAGVHSVNEYLKRIEKDPKERIHFLDAISTNHTYFFRERHHFDCLKNGPLSIWCAASSSGEEPYSIAIDCLEKGIQATILATDISTHVLQLGEKGIYHIERTKDTASDILKKYFQKGQSRWEGYIRVKKEVREMVKFRRFNLITDPVPSTQFDAIFCRNVLIYFNHLTKTKVVNRLFNSLKRGGYFVVGGAESLNNISHHYKYVKPSIYTK